MAKKIKFEFEGTQYVLEYTRGTVRDMEADGFDPSVIDSKPMTMIPMLIEGAFRKNHPFTKTATVDKIYQSIPRKEEFVRHLIEMYNEPLNSLIEEPEDGEGNVAWEMTE